MAERKAVIKNADMAEDMQQDAVECATQVCVYNASCLHLSSPVLFTFLESFGLFTFLESFELV